MQFHLKYDPDMTESLKSAIFALICGLLLLLTDQALGVHPRHENYNDCGQSYSCYGTAYDKSLDNCVTVGDCKTMIKYKHDPENAKFLMELHHNFSNPEAPKAYAALGISIDHDMGDDVVFYCNQDASPTFSYNVGKQNMPGVIFDKPEPLSLLATIKDGVRL